MVKDAWLPAGIQLHIVFILVGRAAELELLSLPICCTARAGLTRGLSTGTLQEQGGRWGHTALGERPSLDTAPSIGYCKGK